MTELLVVVGAVAGLLALRYANESIDPEALLRWSGALIAGGMAVGLPASGVYHALLARALARAGGVPRGWWLHPARHHAGLPPEERRRILPWFRVGAAGFLVVSAGAALLFALAMRFVL